MRADASALICTQTLGVRPSVRTRLGGSTDVPLGVHSGATLKPEMSDRRRLLEAATFVAFLLQARVRALCNIRSQSS